jgi:hypothetical protein
MMMHCTPRLLGGNATSQLQARLEISAGFQQGWLVGGDTLVYATLVQQI